MAFFDIIAAVLFAIDFKAFVDSSIHSFVRPVNRFVVD